MDQDVAITVSAQDEASKKLQDVSKNMEGVGDVGDTVREKLQKASLAVGAIGVALTAYSKSAVDSTVDYVKSVNTLSRQTGMAVDTTSKLVYAFQRSGISADQASASLGIFSKQIVAANEGAKDAALKQADLKNKMEVTRAKIAELTAEVAKNGDKSGDLGRQIQGLNIQLQGYANSLSEATSPLEKINVATKNADGSARSFNDILLDVADRFKEMPNGAEKTALSMELFGRSGKDLIPILNKGKEGIQELGDAAEKLGLVITSKNVKAVADYTKANKDLADSQQALKLAVGTEALPMWQKLSEVTNQAVSSVLKLPEPFHSAAVGILAFGGPIATAVAGMANFGANLGGMADSFPIVGKALGSLGSSFGALGSLLLGWPGLILLVVGGLIFLELKFHFLQKAITDLYTWAKPVFDWFGTNVLPLLQQVGAFVGGIFVDAWHQLQAAFTQLWIALQPVMPYLKILGEVILGIVIVAIVAALVPIALLIAAIIGIATALAWVIARIAEFYAFMLRTWNSISSTVIGTVSNMIGGVVRFFSDFPNNVKNAIGNLGNMLVQTGKDLINGLINGIGSAKDAVVNKIKDVARGAVDAFKNFLGIHSPSRVFIEMGGYIGAGLIKGIDAMQSAAAQSAAALGGAVSDGFNGSAAMTSPAFSAAVSPVAPGLNGAAAAGNTSSVNNNFYGNFNMADQNTVDYFMARMDRDAERAAQGAPV